MQWLQNAWFSPKLTVALWALAPLTLVFYCLSSLRRLGYRSGLLKSSEIPVPVIVVGNISVGGNGKTPLVIRLAQWLRQEGYQPGVLSRGYGGSAKRYPTSVTSESSAVEVGDEPVLMRQYLPCPLVVDPIRVRGANHLVEKHKCNVIICDDGMQHYALKRDIEIAVVDGERGHGNGFLLPMGPLREGRWRLDKVDFVIANGGKAAIGEHLMTLESGHLTNVKYANQTKSVQAIKKSVTAVAAIGNPERFFKVLRNKQIALKQTLVFPDHHKFSAKDIPRETVLMTEKDAVKCKDFAYEDWWYLPVTAKLSEALKTQLLMKLKHIGSKRGRNNGP